MRRFLGPLADPFGALAAERGQLFPWVPVFLSLGIGPWFALRVEPGPVAYLSAGALALAGLMLWRRGAERWQIPGAALMLVAAGFLLAGHRANSVAAPVLDFRYYGSIEGRIVAIDRSFSDETRLTLDDVVLERVAPDRTPALVRVALHGKQGFVAPEPGLRVILSGHLSPPEGPVEPGGFDFQRLAWFARLGAVGYTRSPVLALEPAGEGAGGLGIHRLRMRLSASIRERIEGQSGALAAALMTGDRSGIAAATNDAMRGSNLSHLISISGLHMGLLTGFVFMALRHGLSLVPPVALRMNVKKISAAVALLAAAFYLALSGMNVATVRAFLMVAVMLFAVLLDRRAMTLRSVAIAAVLILAAEPESLIEPGFQMSFGATTALVAVFGLAGRWQARVPKALVPVATLLLSSFVAGLATAPIAAAHFNRVAEYGLLANLVAVPLTGFVVMPAGVVAALLAPLGLEAPALWALDLGCRGILATAHWVAGLEGAVFAVPAPPPEALPLMGLGALAALLARRAVRTGGAVAVLAALATWSVEDRPALLVSADGELIGLMTEEGRALSKPKGAGFVAKSWLEDDGDLSPQESAYVRSGLFGTKGALTATIGATPVFHFTGKAAPEAAQAACVKGTVVILAGIWSGGTVTCDLYDAARLGETGALAVREGPQGIAVETAREAAGERLWNQRPERGAGKRLALSRPAE